VDPLTYEYAGDLTLNGEFAQASYIAGDGDSFSVRRIITGISRLPAYF